MAEKLQENRHELACQLSMLNSVRKQRTHTLPVPARLVTNYRAENRQHRRNTD